VPTSNSIPRLWRCFSPFPKTTGLYCAKTSAHPFASLVFLFVMGVAQACPSTTLRSARSLWGCLRVGQQFFSV
jgi:hypothetical protein